MLAPLELGPLDPLDPLPMLGHLCAGVVVPPDRECGLAVDVDDGLLLGTDDELADDEVPELGDGLLLDVAAIATPTPPASRPAVMAPPTTTRRNIAGLLGGMCISFFSEEPPRDPR